MVKNISKSIGLLSFSISAHKSKLWLELSIKSCLFSNLICKSRVPNLSKIIENLRIKLSHIKISSFGNKNLYSLTALVLRLPFMRMSAAISAFCRFVCLFWRFLPPLLAPLKNLVIFYVTARVPKIALLLVLVQNFGVVQNDLRVILNSG